MRAAVIGGGFAGRVHVQALRSIGVEPYLIGSPGMPFDDFFLRTASDFIQ